MKGKYTLANTPFRYGGLQHDYEKEIHEIHGREEKCWCCGGDMKSHSKSNKLKPYAALFKITKGGKKGAFPISTTLQGLCL